MLTYKTINRKKRMNILHKADVHAPTLTILIRPLQN